MAAQEFLFFYIGPFWAPTLLVSPDSFLELSIPDVGRSYINRMGRQT